MREPLDPRDITEAILDLTEREGCPPTYRELADELGVSLSGAAWWCARLRDMGMVDWKKGSSRTLRVIR